MEKYLVTIEFRYSDAPPEGYNYTSHTKTITIGVYDDFDEACVHGNKLMETMESKFKLHVFPDGKIAKKERFSKNGGCFGSKKDLITNLAYLSTPFSFFAKITTLKYSDIDDTINDVVMAGNRYKEYKKAIND